MTTFPLLEPFELTITVESADIDLLSHVNNVVYVRWIQDVAIAHWDTMASPADRQSYFWVITRHEIDYKAPAVLGDTIIARTWVGPSSRARFQRHTEIFRARDRRTLARSVAFWCPVDPRTGKPVTLNAETRARFSTGSV